MRGVNRVTLVGNLGQEPELKYTQGNHAILRLRIATNERLPAKGGETRDHTEWHTVTCWGKRAERLSKELRKGSGVYVEGRLTTRSWEDRDGNKRYATEVSSDVVVALAREATNGADGDDRTSRGRQGSLPGAGEDASPFDSEPGQGDDDIPFDRAPTAAAEAVGAHPAVMRFWARVARTDRCWEWTGPTYQATGYGQTTAQLFGKTSMTAHRFAWLVTRGPIVGGLHVLHDCDNRRCVRPDHLRLGTHADNMRDMVSRGRSFYARAKGLPRRRLSDEQRASVLTSTESTLALARRLGVDEKTVRAIRRRRGKAA